MPSPDWETAEEPRLVVHGQRARTEPLGSPSIDRPIQWSFPFDPEEANQGRVCSQSSRYSSTSEGISEAPLEGGGEESSPDEEVESSASDPEAAAGNAAEEELEEEEEAADPEEDDEEDEEEAASSTEAEVSRRVRFRERPGRCGLSLPRSVDGG